MGRDPLDLCRRCGDRDWYVRGSYRRCRACERQADRDRRARQALGQTQAPRRGRYRPRGLAASLQSRDPAVAVRRRAQTTCRQGHSLDAANTRLETDKAGRQHRRCKACERQRARRSYGLTGTGLPRQAQALSGALNGPNRGLSLARLIQDQLEQ